MKTVNALKKTIHALSITLALGCLISAPTFAAGPGSDGGGNSAEDAHGQRRLLDLIEQDELEYFDFHLRRMKEYDETIVNNIRGETCAGSLIFCRVVSTALGLGTVDLKANHNLDVKPLRWAFVDFDLKDINDTGTIRIENPKTKKQLAIQKNGLVIVNKKEFDSIDGESKAALKLHESLLYAVKVLNPDLLDEKGTEPVRTYVRRWVKYLKSNYSYPIDAVQDAYHDLKIEDALKEQERIAKGEIPIGTKLVLRNKLPSFPNGENICVSNKNKCMEYTYSNGNKKANFSVNLAPGCLILESEKQKELLKLNSSFIVEKTYAQKIKLTKDFGEYTIIELLSNENNRRIKISCTRDGLRSLVITTSTNFAEIKWALADYFSFETPRKSQKNSADGSGETASSEATTSSAE